MVVGAVAAWAIGAFIGGLIVRYTTEDESYIVLAIVWPVVLAALVLALLVCAPALAGHGLIGKIRRVT